MFAVRTYQRRSNALIFREWMTRFSGGVIGPYWAQITPIIWISFLTYLFYFLGRSPPINAPTSIFVATGVLPYLAFRQTVTSMSRSLIANRHLKYIKPVDSNEILKANSVVETMNLTVTSILIFGGLGILEGMYFPSDYGRTMIGFLLIIGVSTSFGRLVAHIGLYSDSFARFTPIALRPLFWVSGIFYTATEIPKIYLDVLWFNPLFHIAEFVREGFFLGYRSPIATIWYPVAVICALRLIETALQSSLQRTGRERFGI